MKALQDANRDETEDANGDEHVVALFQLSGGRGDVCKLFSRS